MSAFVRGAMINLWRSILTLFFILTGLTGTGWGNTVWDKCIQKTSDVAGLHVTPYATGSGFSTVSFWGYYDITNACQQKLCNGISLNSSFQDCIKEKSGSYKQIGYHYYCYSDYVGDCDGDGIRNDTVCYDTRYYGDAAKYAGACSWYCDLWSANADCIENTLDWQYLGNANTGTDCNKPDPSKSAGFDDLSDMLKSCSVPEPGPSDGPAPISDPAPGPGNDSDDPCPSTMTAGSTVSMATANLHHEQKLFSLAGPIGMRNFSLIYNSHDPLWRLGYGWTHTYDYWLLRNGDGTYLLGSGYDRTELLKPDGGIYRPLPRKFPALSFDAAGKGTVRFKNGLTLKFSTLGYLTGASDNEGNSVAVSYDDSGLLKRITDAAGKVVSFAYNNYGRIETITDTRNVVHAAEYLYEGRALLRISSKIPGIQDGNRIWNYTYWTETINGQEHPRYLKTKTDPVGNMTTYHYDAEHRLRETVDQRSGTRSMFYQNSSHTSAFTDANGGVWAFLYDPSTGLLQEKTDPYGTKTVFKYDTRKRRKSVTVSAQNKSGEWVELRKISYTEYDSNDNATKITDMDGVMVYKYNTMNQITEVTDQTGATTIYGYKQGTRSITIPGGRTVTFAEGEGSVTVTMAPEGRSWKLTYGTYGDLISYEDPRGNKTIYEYNSFGEVKRIIDPYGKVTEFGYDGMGNRVLATDANGNQVAYRYDHDGNLTGVTLDPSVPQENYPGLDLFTQFIREDAGCSCTSSNGKLAAIVDANGKETVFKYDLVGNLSSRTDSYGRMTQFFYDELNRPSDVMDAAGAITSFGYENGRLSSVTDPITKTTTYQRDGLSVTKTDRNGEAVVNKYLPGGLIETVTYADGRVTGYSHDAYGRLTSMTDRLGATKRVYDDANRKVTVTDANGFVVVHTYDAAGNLAALTYPGNKGVTYGYDKLNRLETVQNWLGQTSTYKYDDAGRLTGITNFNGTLTSYGYDNANRLKGKKTSRSDGSVIASYEIARMDGVGNVRSLIRNEPIAGAALCGTTTYAYNSTKNRLLSADGTGLGHDFEGQLASKGLDIFVFNADHRLTRVSGSSIMDYHYDGLGNRLKAGRDGVTTHYVYDLRGNLIAETDATGSIQRYYIHGAGLLAMVTPSGQSYTYHFDHNGNTVALTNQSQAVVNSYAYLPFGNITAQSETLSQPFKFVGEYGVMAEPNGLYYMRARYYDPEVGRFISEDPIGFEGGTVNLYEYVGNNPVNRKDPFGLWYVDVNVSLGYGGGGTAGVLVNNNGVYPYAGGGIVSPPGGVSVTWSPSDPTTGWNVGLQGGYWGGGQGGYGFGEGGGPFWEGGFVTPGGSLTGYYVLGPFWGPKKPIQPAKCH